MPLLIKDFETLFGEQVIDKKGDLATEVRAISYDSREVVPGTLFFCKGLHFKASYLQEAIKKGAVGYVAEQKMDVDLPYLQIKDMRAVLAPAARLFYGDPQKKLKLVAVTGTKGKSSTVWYLKNILDRHAEKTKTPKAGLLSSILTDDGKRQQPSILTTPEPFELQALLAGCVENGVETVIMEVSSQALKMGRTAGLQFSIGAFLNIAPDHLSPIEHPTFDDYLASKLRLFAQSETALVHQKTAHLDSVMEAARASKRVLTMGEDTSADVRYTLENVRPLTFRVASARLGEEVSFLVQMDEIATFSAENGTMAATIALLLGVPPMTVQEGLAHVRVPGRMQEFQTADGAITAIVDYAHNGLSFAALFQAVRARYPGAKTIAVFGSAGGKSFNRRLDMAKVVDKEANFVILTNEDPHDEDPDETFTAIAAGLTAVPYEVIQERSEAIHEAFLKAERLVERGDTVVILLLGKGEELLMYMAEENVPYEGDGPLAERWISAYDARTSEKN